MRIFLSLCLFFAVSCGETQNNWDDLTDEQREYIENLVKQQCIDNYLAVYNDYKSDVESYFTSTSFARGTAFDMTFDEESNTDTVRLQVWKQTSTDVYFLVTDDSGETTSNYYLRISLSTSLDFIDQIYADHCDQEYTLEGTDQQSYLSFSLQYTEDAGSGSTAEDILFTDKFTFNFGEPPWWSIYSRNRTKDELDSEGNVLATTTFNRTLSGVSDPPALETTLPGYSFYCDVPTDSSGLYRFPLEINTGDCATILPGDWDMTL